MASQHAERYDDITLQISQNAQRSGDIYMNDSRYSYIRGVDSTSFSEAKAMQTANASGVAMDAMQLRTAVQTPPIIVVPKT